MPFSHGFIIALKKLVGYQTVEMLNQLPIKNKMAFSDDSCTLTPAMNENPGFNRVNQWQMVFI